MLPAVTVAALSPPVTVTSSAVKPFTSSLKVKVKVTGPVAVASVTLSVISTVGATVSAGSAPPQALRVRAATKAPAKSVDSFARRFMVSTPDWIWVMKIK